MFYLPIYLIKENIILKNEFTPKGNDMYSLFIYTTRREKDQQAIHPILYSHASLQW